MSQARPRGGELALPAAVLAVLGAPLAVVWLTGALGGLFAHGHPLSASLGESAQVLLALPRHLGSPQLAWPRAARPGLPTGAWLELALGLCVLIVLGALSALLVFAGRLSPRARAGRAARFADRAQLRELRLRKIPAPGRVILGKSRGGLIAAEVRASTLVVGPSQSGKTSGLVIPALLEWAGPAIATSVKGDLVNDTRAARAARGKALIFDPTRSSGKVESQWSPLCASSTWSGARRTAARLLGVGHHRGMHSADESFWRPAGARYLAPLLLAAAYGGLSMREVLSWVATGEEDAPTKLLRDCPDPGAAPGLDAAYSVWKADPRFRSSLTQTVATALDAWHEPDISEATVADTQISPEWLLSGPNTLYLISPADDQRRLQGLFSALLADVIAGAFAASARKRRPIDPPLLLCLDEAANIAPLPNLDEIASTGAGQGVQLLTVFQDLSQASERWGRERAETIIANHRARVFTPGIGDRATLEYLSHTLGEEEIQRISTHRAGPLAHGSRTHSSEFRSLAPPNRVREQSSEGALLVYGRLAPAWIALRPWFSDRALSRLAKAEPARSVPQARRSLGGQLRRLALSFRRAL